MFPFLQSPARTVFVDDDEVFLHVLGRLIPQEMHGCFCLSPQEVDRVLASCETLLEEERARLVCVNSAAAGKSLVRAIEYLLWPGRRDIFSILVADQTMPAEMGDVLCARYGLPGLQRVLLTGAADENLAVKSFNEGAIDHFLPKQSANLSASLLQALAHLHQRSLSLRAGSLLWSKPYWPGFDATDVIASLRLVLDAECVRDYVVVECPLGLMCQRSDNSILWIQLDEESTFAQMAEVLKDFGWQQPEVQILEKEHIASNVELFLQLRNVVPSFTKSVALGCGAFASVFPVKTCWV